MVDYGLVNIGHGTKSEVVQSYMIMPRYGNNLESYMTKVEKFSKSTTLHIGLSTLAMLQQIHSAGYVYNDLKLDNILVGFRDKIPSTQTSKDALKTCSLHLVDFGYATRYISRRTGQHIEKSDVSNFRGNMIFGSVNQLNFMKTSRRDDLMSLVYMLVYLLNDGELLDIDLSKDVEKI